LTVAALFIH